MEPKPKESVQAIRAGIEEGANHIDTAEMYGSGRVEDIVGEAIKGLRDKVFIVSKVLPSNADAKNTILACERSLKHLQIACLDVYLLHWRGRGQTPLEETFRAFEKLHSDGKIRAWGVSNFSVGDLNEAVGLVGEEKLFATKSGIPLMIAALNENFFPGAKEHKIPFLWPIVRWGQGRLPRHSALDAVAKELQATSAQVALAFLIRNHDVIAIPKSSDADRTRENVRAMKIVLNADQVAVSIPAFPAKS